jgi:hypothetical protein
LKVLFVPNTRITDEGLRYLGALPNLEELEISGTDIGDQGLRHLAAAPKLVWLDAGRTKLTDAAVPTIVQMKSLQVVGLDGTALTDAGVLALRRRLPMYWDRKHPLPLEAVPGMHHAYGTAPTAMPAANTPPRQ